jgi:hypothetical protein
MSLHKLICEICREPIATFDPTEVVPRAEMSGLVNLQAFRSLYPERQVPPPFPAALDDWRLAACPRCRCRPFFNHMEKGDGTVIIATGETVPEGGQWYLSVEGDSGLIEKVLLSEIREQAPPEQPSQIRVEANKNVPENELWFVKDGEPKAILTGIEADSEPTGNYTSRPVLCPHCGKQFRSQGRLEKYHTPCPSLPPQEGFKI